jgi:hypothetical protein
VPDSWWVYDKPLWHDALFIVSVMCGVGTAIAAVGGSENVSVFAWVYNILGGAAAGFYAAGVVGGSARNLVRGFREGSSR